MADRFAHVPIPEGYAALPFAAKAVWDALCYHQRWKDAKPIPMACYPSQATIAETAGVARSTVQKGIKQLEERGWIQRVVSHFGSAIDATHYILLAAGMPRDGQAEPRDKLARPPDGQPSTVRQAGRDRETVTNTSINTTMNTRGGTREPPAPSTDEKQEARKRAIREARSRR